MGSNKTRRKTSIIWTGLTDKQFTDLIEKSITMKNVTDYFGLSNKGGNFRTAKERIKSLGLNIDHFLNNTESSINTRRITEKVLTEEWLVCGRTRNNTDLKRYLFKYNLLEECCSKCGCGKTWQDEPISLHLDHINGEPKDNRLVNLRILCPNCHSQTETFAGKRFRKKWLCKCGSEKAKSSECCMSCYSNKQRKVVDRPDKHQLLRELKESNFLQLSKKYGVSDNAVRKWCRTYGIPTKRKEYINFWFDTTTQQG